MTQEDKERYLRQITLPEIGEVGQQRLASTSVLVVGVGGLGSPISTLLVSSGIGRIGLVDFDRVSLSNLPRQTLYTTDDIGKLKVECAYRRLHAINPSAKIEVYNQRLDEMSAVELISQYDIIVDGCDNMATRYILDRVAGELFKPYVYGAISGFVGQVSIFHHNGAGAYRDLFPKQDAGAVLLPPAVIATTPAIVGAIEANEVIKIAVGIENTLAGRLLTMDSRDYSFNILEL